MPELSWRILLAVPPSLITGHSELSRVVNGCQSFEIALTPLREDLFTSFKESISRITKTWYRWQLLRTAVKAVEPDLCLVMYIDQLLLPLALGMDPGCNLSGIYFRPTFHYPRFAGYRPNLGDRVLALRQRVLVERAARSPRLRDLFCLDTFVPDVINASEPVKKALPLPEPVEPHKSNSVDEARLRRTLNLDEGRIVLLLFGMISERKGPHELLEACGILQSSVARKFSLVIAGKVEDQLSACLAHQVAAMQQTCPVQIILHDHLVAYDQVPPFFGISDVVLATYHRHVGMSAIIARSAAAGKPVLSSDFGLMGQLVRTWRLGLTIDSTNPAAIAQALTQIAEDGGPVPFDAESAARFAELNTAESFGATLFAPLLRFGEKET